MEHEGQNKHPRTHFDARDAISFDSTKDVAVLSVWELRTDPDGDTDPCRDSDALDERGARDRDDDRVSERELLACVSPAVDLASAGSL